MAKHTAKPSETNTEPMESDCKTATVSRRSGWLKFGNPPGDPHSSPRCGAKTRAGAPCRAPGIKNRKTGQYGRCRIHGGKSTGPKTEAGRERSAQSNYRHGHFTAAAIARRRESKAKVQAILHEIKGMNAELERLIRERDRAARRAEQEAPQQQGPFMLTLLPKSQAEE